MELIVGTGSTWSLRVWICLQLVEVKTKVHVIDLTADDYYSEILAFSPSGLVPAFLDGTISLYDSLAIVEYINEISRGSLYPKNIKKRALARSLCAEMHSGFAQLRCEFPFSLNVESIPSVFSDKVNDELRRIKEIFASAQIPFMFEKAGAVDAFYAILALRLNDYGISLTGKAGEYQKSLLSWELLQKALSQARQWQQLTEQ